MSSNAFVGADKETTLPTHHSFRRRSQKRLKRRQFRRSSCERLEQRQLLAADFRITEFMAHNESTLQDVDGDWSDWIEVRNQGTEAGSLLNWSLSDDSNRLDRWQFPDVQLDAGEALLVFASDKDRQVAGAELHTNFNLDSTGEFLALSNPNGEVVQSFGDAYPAQAEDVSYGVADQVEIDSLVADAANATAFIPSNDDLGLDWTGGAEPFDDSSWQAGTTGIGFDDGTGSTVTPLFHLPLDSINGDVTPDASGNFNGTVVGATLTNNGGGVTGEALSFDGTDDYVTLGDVQQLDTPSAFTVSLWFQRTADNTSATNHGVNNVLIAQSSAGDNDNFEIGTQGNNIEIYIDSTGQDGPNPFVISNVGVNNDTWHHLVMTYDSSLDQELSLYLDGEHVFSSDQWGGNLDASNSSPLTLGIARPSGPLWGDFTGLMDDVAMWDFAISANEADQLSQGTPPANLFGYQSRIGLDVAAMQGTSASLYTRIPFQVADAAAVDRLRLTTNFDDGIVAFVNGTEVQRENIADGPLSWQTTAVTARDGNQQEVIEFPVFAGLLQDGTNTLSFQVANIDAGDGDLLLEPRLDAVRVVGSEVAGYFSSPSPDAPNGELTDVAGPRITSVTRTVNNITTNDPIVINATVDAIAADVDQVELVYRVMYGAEVTLPMLDDGVAPDATADDGVYTASIPAAVAAPGEMVRWFVRSSDVENNDSRLPLWSPIIADENRTPEYYGTVITNPEFDATHFQWFLEPGTEGAADTESGTRAGVSYLGEFYDNVMVRIRGGSTRGLVKKSYKFDFNPDNHFRFSAEEDRVEEFNLNTTYTDKTYIRQTLGYEVFDAAGAPGSMAFLMPVLRNGEFFSVATFVEQPDTRLLEREGLDPDGALYKMFNTMTSGTAGVEKRTRTDEPNDDLVSFVNNINSLAGVDLENYIFDNLDVPAVLSHLAASVLIQNNDNQAKNYFVYRDTNDTGEWLLLPWDLDLTFGRHFMTQDSILSDILWANRDLVSPPEAGASISPSHPFVGEQEHPGNRSWNRLVDALYEVPRFREMYLRRLRTLMDTFLQTPQTPANELWMEQRIDQLIGESRTVIDQDSAIWAAPWWGSDESLDQSVQRLKDEYLAVRREHLFTTHATGAGGESVEIPIAQIANIAIEFGAIEFSPASGNQDEEYIELTNPNDTAVDVSGWRLRGGVEHEFAAGVVIPANGSMYVSPNVAAFRARTSGVSGGQGLFVQGNYRGHLSSFGETLELYNQTDEIVATTSYEGNPSAPQQQLRITEVNYNPHPPTDAELGTNPNLDNDDFEFIEVVNTGDTALSLNGVRLTEGIDFDFPEEDLASGERAVIVKNTAAFQLRYPGNHRILGEFVTTSLSNGGERIKLEDSLNGTIHDFSYDDEGDWPAAADGYGGTLVVINVAGQYNDPFNWTSSVLVGGSPGIPTALSNGVVVNEALSHSEVPSVDWIELHNPTNFDVDISGWFISDSVSQLAKYEIPPNTVLTAGGYFVVSEAEFNPGQGANPTDFALNSAHGDEVWLVATIDGVVTEFVDDVEFGAQAAGESWGRAPNGSGSFYPLTIPTLDAENAPPRIGPVVISEVMYQPLPQAGFDANDLEFVEIHNPTTNDVDLTNWQLNDAVDYQFPAGMQLVAGGTIVVLSFDPTDPLNSERADSFRAHYGVAESAILIGGYAGRLANEGERIQLLRPDVPPLDEPEFIPLLLEDEVWYSNQADWPLSAAGQGDSLHREEPSMLGNTPSSWLADTPTPGDAISAAISPLDIRLNANLLDPVDLPDGPQPTSWAVQKSDLASVQIVFNRIPILTRSDLVLTNLGIEADQDPDMVIPDDVGELTVAGNVATLTFEPFQLADGVYRLEMLASVQDTSGNDLDGNGDGTGGDALVYTGDANNRFYKLAADFNGDFGATIFDFPTLAYWFGTSTPFAPNYVDMNQDGGVSIFDFPTLSINFGVTVVPPAAKSTAREIRSDVNESSDAAIGEWRVMTPREASLLQLIAWNERRNNVRNLTATEPRGDDNSPRTEWELLLDELATAR